ncbi:MAG: divergent polysaccharide deacetylase family protein [Thermodesulfobacteria bacterium]|nr:divergent polysaccharide deacetylase family protein [Thermodesulfobacteriota bacterium]
MPRRKKKRPAPTLLGWAFWLSFLLITFLAALWVLKPLKTPPRKKPPEKTQTKPQPRPRIKAEKAPKREKKKATTRKPLACIIIDDMGQAPEMERRFFHLGLPLNFSFLPEAPFTRKLASEAYARGFEVLVHLPLEAEHTRDHSAFITLRMDEVEVKRRVREAVRRVPFAIAVNHHMGSAFTAEERHMRWVLEEVKALGLFYIDSRTTPKTVVPKLARELGLPFAERRVFLDHQQEYEAVCEALEKFIRRAKSKGPTLAIAHPHPETLKALEAFRERLRREVDLCPVSVFVKRGRNHD